MIRVEEVSLRGLQFHTRVGILPHEREYPQLLVVDVTVWRVPAAPGQDVLDYRRLHAVVAAHVAHGRVEYLETAAHAIADVVIGEAGVRRVRVVLRKPQVALPDPLAAAEVAVDVTNDG